MVTPTKLLADLARSSASAYLYGHISPVDTTGWPDTSSDRSYSSGLEASYTTVKASNEECRKRGRAIKRSDSDVLESFFIGRWAQWVGSAVRKRTPVYHDAAF